MADWIFFLKKISPLNKKSNQIMKHSRNPPKENSLQDDGGKVLSCVKWIFFSRSIAERKKRHKNWEIDCATLNDRFLSPVFESENEFTIDLLGTDAILFPSSTCFSLGSIKKFEKMFETFRSDGAVRFPRDTPRNRSKICVRMRENGVFLESFCTFFSKSLFVFFSVEIFGA